MWTDATQQSIPKDGKEYLTKNNLQGGVKQLISWNTIHGYYQNKGVRVYEGNAGTHWMEIPEENKNYGIDAAAEISRILMEELQKTPSYIEAEAKLTKSIVDEFKKYSNIDTDIKYIYFEIKYVTGGALFSPEIENENVLLIKPNTNSSGVWGFRNVTERRKGLSEYSVVEQNWIDLDKYKFGIFPYEKLDEQIKYVLRKLEEKINNEKI